MVLAYNVSPPERPVLVIAAPTVIAPEAPLASKVKVPLEFQEIGALTKMLFVADTFISLPNIPPSRAAPSAVALSLEQPTPVISVAVHAPWS
jgi:hypothetical protein